MFRSAPLAAAHTLASANFEIRADHFACCMIRSKAQGQRAAGERGEPQSESKRRDKEIDS